jgi:flagellar hook-associated protein 2
MNAQSEEERTAGIAANLAERTAALNNTYQDLQARLADAQSQITTLTDALSGQDGFDSDDLDATLSRWTTQKNELASQIEATEDEEEKANLQTQLDALNEKISSAESLKSQEETAADVQARMADLEQFIDPSTGEATDALRAQVEADYDARIAAANAALSDDDAAATRYATKIKGQDAEIYLNGARFTNNTNNFSINGLTITALSKTADNEEVTLTTTNDTDGIYDNIKNFLKQYNTVINKMDALYNADSIRKYEMLTDEEKEAMSESEVKTYEDKIKDGLLRRDETIGSISSALKKVMSSGYEVDGVKMYLTSFGIGTGDYFSTPDNEKNALHIDGDPDDSMTSGNADKLKAMIASDPDKVISFFTQMSKDLYSSMSELSASRSGYRTYGTFFDDVKMKADYSDFTSKIDDLEEKANDYEDKLYAKFSAMETALAKLQSKTSALSGLIGTGN